MDRAEGPWPARQPARCRNGETEARRRGPQVSPSSTLSETRGNVPPSQFQLGKLTPGPRIWNTLGLSFPSVQTAAAPQDPGPLSAWPVSDARNQ